MRVLDLSIEIIRLINKLSQFYFNNVHKFVDDKR